MLGWLLGAETFPLSCLRAYGPEQEGNRRFILV